MEAEILYTAVFHDEKTLHFAPEKLLRLANIVSRFEGGEKLEEIVQVYDVSAEKCEIYHDITSEHLMVTI